MDLMLKLAREHGRVRVVDDEVITPTSTSQLAKQIVILSRCNAYGLYHATAEGKCSWHEFAREIFQLTNTDVRLEVATAGEFRPRYNGRAMQRTRESRTQETPFERIHDVARRTMRLPRSLRTCSVPTASQP